MKLSWFFVILLLVFVAVFSVQNADVISVQFLTWQIQMSAALVIQLAALLGALVGLAFGTWSRRSPRPVEKPRETPPAAAARSGTPMPGAGTTAPMPIAPRPEKKPDVH
jgi:uncharacterized integral membrane protein